MTVYEHISNTRRTWRIQTPELDMQHANLGIIDETGELASAFKKVIGYGRDLDAPNIKEECGDLLYFICRIQDQKELDVVPDEVVTRMFSTVDEEVSDFQLIMLLAKSAGKIADYCEVYSGDKSYCTQELNYMTYLIYNILDRVRYTLKETREANINKLKARYPNAWNEEQAVNRDLATERKTLE